MQRLRKKRLRHLRRCVHEEALPPVCSKWTELEALVVSLDVLVVRGYGELDFGVSVWSEFGYIISLSSLMYSEVFRSILSRKSITFGSIGYTPWGLCCSNTTSGTIYHMYYFYVIFCAKHLFPCFALFTPLARKPGVKSEQVELEMLRRVENVGAKDVSVHPLGMTHSSPFSILPRPLENSVNTGFPGQNSQH